MADGVAWARARRSPTTDELCEVAWCRLLYFGDDPRVAGTAFYVVRDIIEACIAGHWLQPVAQSG